MRFVSHVGVVGPFGKGFEDVLARARHVRETLDVGGSLRHFPVVVDRHEAPMVDARLDQVPCEGGGAIFQVEDGAVDVLGEAHHHRAVRLLLAAFVGAVVLSNHWKETKRTKKK